MLSRCSEPLTQYEADHGAEVAGPTAKVEEGEARVEIQSLHHLRVDTRSRQMDVSMPPCQVLTTTIEKVNQLSLTPQVLQPISLLKPKNGINIE